MPKFKISKQWTRRRQSRLFTIVYQVLLPPIMAAAQVLPSPRPQHSKTKPHLPFPTDSPSRLHIIFQPEHTASVLFSFPFSKNFRVRRIRDSNWQSIGLRTSCEHPTRQLTKARIISPLLPRTLPSFGQARISTCLRMIPIQRSPCPGGEEYRQASS